MIRTLSVASLGAALIVACGQAEPSPAAPQSQASAETSSNEPEVGEWIDDTPAREARDNSLVAAAEREAQRKADLAARGLTEIGWEDLMPEGEEEILMELFQQQMTLLYSGAPIVEGSAADAMVQIGTFNTVPELNEKKVRIPGYTVPFDFDAEARISEFLLVPYFGACIHAPPPPPNQTIFIMTEEPIRLRDLAQAVWIEGTLYTQTQESQLADAAYTIRLERLETYTY